jgi:phosphoadenosine phosphosulfate reductase
VGNYQLWTEASALRWKLPPMRARTYSALRLIRACLSRCQNPYVAFSTGKDSQVVLDLALSIKPDLPVVFHDEDWVLPGTIEQVAATEAHYGIRILRVRERRAADEFYAQYGVWPQVSQPRGVDFEADTWKEIVRHYGFDGVLIGLRADESVRRFFSLKRPLRLVENDGLWHGSPLFDWTTEQVWSYLVGNHAPVHPAYREMIDAGVEPRFARVGPLTAVRVYQYGSLEIVKRLYPSLWNAFVAENPCVAFG